MKLTGFVRATLLAAALVGTIGGYRAINALIEERNAWKRYADIEYELGLFRGMPRSQLTAQLESKGIEYKVEGDPSRPPDGQPAQVVFVVVAKWTGTMFPQQLFLAAELGKDGALVKWQPLPQGGP